MIIVILALVLIIMIIIIPLYASLKPYEDRQITVDPMRSLVAYDFGRNSRRNMNLDTINLSYNTDVEKEYAMGYNKAISLQTYLNDHFDQEWHLNVSFHDSWPVNGVLSYGGNDTQMPDYYHTRAYNGKLEQATEKTKWTSKQNSVCLAGSCTGSTDLTKNERYAWKMWAEDKPWADVRVVSVQTPEHTFPLQPKMTLEEQLKCKFILSIEGNAAAWDRPAWVMQSNSILLMADATPRKKLWYYDYIPFIYVTRENIKETMDSITPEMAKEILKKQKIAVNTFLTQHSIEQYWNGFMMQNAVMSK